ncbi:PrpF domain-containing protein [Streptomyces sp. NPDC127092]|uniref:PrpF domain-containing protein n=1 Tax=Streptomyces sp. NPDC127092 TaxID=3347135 RepID=UPI00364CE21C
MRPEEGGRRGRAHGVLAHVVLAEDAPGPTLVVRRDRLPPGALASSGELARLRQALARTPYAGLNKIALYGPSAGTAADLDYRFVQALPGGRFDFRAGCGHSLLACVVADGRAGREVTVRAVTTRDVVRCVPQGDGAYTLDFLRPPGVPGTLPTGRPVDVLDGVPVTLVRYGNPYVLVDARHLGADARHLPADSPHLPADALQARLLELRARAARLLGYAPESPLPKIALFTRTGPDRLAVRALTVGGWHPRLALTGAAAFAAAGALGGTVVGGPVARLRTPHGGTVTVSTAPDRVRVHHKRARLLQRLELPWPAPWRIHATA